MVSDHNLNFWRESISLRTRCEFRIFFCWDSSFSYRTVNFEASSRRADLPNGSNLLGLTLRHNSLRIKLFLWLLDSSSLHTEDMTTSSRPQKQGWVWIEGAYAPDHKRMEFFGVWAVSLRSCDDFWPKLKKNWSWEKDIPSSMWAHRVTVR